MHPRDYLKNISFLTIKTTPLRNTPASREKEYLSNRKVSKQKRILKEISDVQAIIHRIKFNSDYSYATLQKSLGIKIKIDSKYKNNQRKGTYKKVGYFSWQGLNFIIFFEGSKGYDKEARIETTIFKGKNTSKETQKALIILATKLPELTFKSIEFAVDFYCDEPSLVTQLFRLFNRYMYFDYVNDLSRLIGREDDYIVERRKENVGIKYSPQVKIYERGPDELNKNGEGGVAKWRYKDIDRVRVEFTIDKPHNRIMDLTNLKHFVESFSFKRNFYNRFNFKVFKHSNKLPREGEEYYIELKEPGRKPKIISFECFQDVYVVGYTQGINMSQCLENAHGFSEVKKEIKSAMVLFDRNWEELRKKYLP